METEQEHLPSFARTSGHTLPSTLMLGHSPETPQRRGRGGGNQKCCCLKCVPLHPDSHGIERERETDKHAALFAGISAPLLLDRTSGQK